MRKTLLTAAAATMLWSQSNAMEFHVGYSNLTGKYHYNKFTESLTQSTNAAKEEEIGIGALSVGAGSMSNINDMFSIGFSIGATMPGDVEFKDEDRYAPVAGGATNGVNSLAGDTVKFELMQIPVMARIGAQFAAGPGNASLGLGAGAVIIPFSVETTDQRWHDGTAGGGESSSKSTTNNVAGGKDINKMSMAAAIFGFQITPGYHYKINDKSSLGLEIPLQILSESEVSVDRIDAPKQYAAPVVNQANPSYSSGFLRNLDLGGFDWAVRVVYTARM